MTLPLNDFTLIKTNEPDTWSFKKHGKSIGKCSFKFLSHDDFIELEEDTMLENGLVNIINASEQNEGICYLDWISINHKERGNKYGGVLLDMTVELLKNKFDGSPIFLNASGFGEVFKGEALVRFYEKRGFTPLTDELNSSCYMFSENVSLLKSYSKNNIESVLVESIEVETNNQVVLPLK